MKVTLPLKRGRPASVPEPVNICEKEDNSVYEADDEDEHFSHKTHRPRPGATISAQNTRPDEQEDKLQRLQEMIEIIGQKTVYFDKTLDLLTKERIKTSKLTDMLEHLQNENKTLRQLINTHPNSEQAVFHIATKASESQYKSPEPFYPPTPVIQECIVTQTLPISIEIFKEHEESLKEQNDILRNEIKEMKAKLAKQDLEKENNKLQKEVKMLKEKLQSSDQKHKDERGKAAENNQIKAKYPKRKQVIIAGDSMLNNIEEKFDLNTKTSNVSVHSFSGATIEDMKDYSIPLLRKEPNVMIIHAGMINVRTDKPSIIVDKLITLQEYIIKIAPSTK